MFKYFKYFIILIHIFYSCKNSEVKNEKNIDILGFENNIQLSELQNNNTNITFGKIEKKNISTILKVQGKIEVPPQNLVEVSVPLGGYLKQTNLLPGTLIKKNEIIAIFEDLQYVQIQQDFLISKNKLLLLEKEYERQKKLNDIKANSEKVYQAIQTEYINQKIITNSLAEKLKLIYINVDSLNENNISKSIKIPSPINGFVSKVNANIGKYINPTEVVFQLINPNDIHLNLKVYEKDIDKLYLGQKLFAYTNIDKENKYLCEIILLSKNVIEDGTIEIHCHFDKYKHHLMPGLFMNADIELKNNFISALPENAIVRYNNQYYVFIENGKFNFQMHEIKIGASQNGYTEVILKPELLDKNFVINGAYNLLMKLKNKSE